MTARLRFWAEGWESPITYLADEHGWRHADAVIAASPGVIVSEVESRTYTIGCPVTVQVDDDGRVTVTTYLGEAHEAVADYDDGEPVAMVPGMLDEQVEDAATVAAAVEAGNYTATTSKGA